MLVAAQLLGLLGFIAAVLRATSAIVVHRNQVLAARLIAGSFFLTAAMFTGLMAFGWLNDGAGAFVTLVLGAGAGALMIGVAALISISAAQQRVWALALVSGLWGVALLAMFSSGTPAGSLVAGLVTYGCGIYAAVRIVYVRTHEPSIDDGAPLEGDHEEEPALPEV